MWKDWFNIRGGESSPRGLSILSAHRVLGVTLLFFPCFPLSSQGCSHPVHTGKCFTKKRNNWCCRNQGFLGCIPCALMPIVSQSPTPLVMSCCRCLVGPITTGGGNRCRMWSEIRNTDGGRVYRILQWLCSASGGKVSCWSARSQSHQKTPQYCRMYQSFHVFSVMCIKSSFTTASERIPCLGFIKRITCQNREPDWERNSALPSLSPG